MTRRQAATIATRVYEPEGTAAAYRLGNLVRALERQGYATLVLTSRSPGAARSTERVRRFPVLRDRSGAVRGYLQYLSFDVPLFFRLLFGPRADVVVAEPPPTTGVVTRLACALRRTPYVYFSADVTSAALKGIRVNRLVARTVTAMERWVLKGASGILAISAGVREELLALGADPQKITVVGTGIDTEKFADAGSTPDVAHPYLIYAGTMSEFQGAEVFVDAFAKISDRFPCAKLALFGGGVDVETLKERARPLGDRVEFTGFVSAEEVACWIRGATASLASVRPGRGYDFAFPTKTLASVSCGTPVIFAGVGPLRELVAERELGWSVDWDADEVAQAMSEALERGRQRLAPSAVAWLGSNFSLSAVADRAVAAIAIVIREQQSGHRGRPEAPH